MSKNGGAFGKHISQLTTWIERERQEEVNQFAAATAGVPGSVLFRRGLALLALRITKSKTGLGGKTIVDVESGDNGSKLPPHQFKTGDVVELTPQGGGKASGKKGDGETDGKTSGVVLRVSDIKLVIALDDAALALEALSCFWKVTQLANEVTYKRMLNVLKDMQRVLSLRHGEKMESSVWPGSKDLISLLLATPTKGKSRVEFDSSVTLDSITFLDTGLNPSQKEAVRHSLAAQHVALIHGPPGTGKTHTLVELIRQFVTRGLRVLVCGPSNAAVDNLLERLVPHHLNCLRVGHPGRVQQPYLMDKVLDIQLRYSDAGQLVRDIRQEMDELLTSAAKCKSRSERKQIYTSLSDLRKDFRTRELRATQELVQGAEVVLSTLSGVGGRVLQQHAFDVVVIDEATQAIEAECWIAISRSKRVVLAGDHHQLPPTIKSGLPGLERTLFLRLLDHGPHVVRMLNVQYRMHSLIMEFSSAQLYHRKLTAHSSVQDHLLKDMKGMEDDDLTSLPLVFLDTAGSDLYESTDEASEKGSRWNSGEAQLVAAHLAKLVGAGLDPKDVAVISPYNGQVALLKTELKPIYPQLEIGSVDGFQGREKEAVIVSLVRSNSDGQVGFLKDYRRLNVAITRARRHLCLIGDSDTVMADRDVPSKNPPPHANFLPELGKYLDENAETWVPEMYD